jgi:hypothetical protein
MNILWVVGAPGAGKTAVTNNLRGVVIHVDAYTVDRIADVGMIGNLLRRLDVNTVVVEGTPLNHGALHNHMSLMGDVTTLFVDATADQILETYTHRVMHGLCELNPIMSLPEIQRLIDDSMSVYSKYEPLWVKRERARAFIEIKFQEFDGSSCCEHPLAEPLLVTGPFIGDYKRIGQHHDAMRLDAYNPRTYVSNKYVVGDSLSVFAVGLEGCFVWDEEKSFSTFKRSSWYRGEEDSLLDYWNVIWRYALLCYPLHLEITTPDGVCTGTSISAWVDRHITDLIMLEDSGVVEHFGAIRQLFTTWSGMNRGVDLLIKTYKTYILDSRLSTTNAFILAKALDLLHNSKLKEIWNMNPENVITEYYKRGNGTLMFRIADDWWVHDSHFELSIKDGVLNGYFNDDSGLRLHELSIECIDEVKFI